MARRRRSDLPDGAFHVIAHAVAREPLFRDDVERRRYLGFLQQTAEAHRWRVLTFVLLQNHVHLLIVAAARDLSPALWWLHWNYATHFHARDPERRGHVFESRPKTLPIRRESYLLAVLRYIANNPVKAGACSRPEDFSWSAHRAILGLAPPLPFLAADDVLRSFGGDVEDARRRYAAFVAGDDPPEHNDVVLRSEGLPRERPSLDDILASRDRIAAVRTAYDRWHYSMRSIAAAAGVSPATISRWIRSAN